MFRQYAQNLATLEERSHRPHRLRQATWSAPLADRVLALRLRYPRWGKAKLAVLIRQQKLTVSTSMVGRILAQLVFLIAKGRSWPWMVGAKSLS